MQCQNNGVKWTCDCLPPLNLWNFPYTAKVIYNTHVEEIIVSVELDEAEAWAQGEWWKLLEKDINNWDSTTKDVIKDLKKREAFGLTKYGKLLTKDTDEDMLQHLYEELLDASVYIKTLINQKRKN